MSEAFERLDVRSGVILPDVWADFRWSDWDPYEVIEEDKTVHAYSFVGIVPLGHVLFSIGCAELVLGPTMGSAATEEATLYLDAFWAAVLDNSYDAPLEIDFDDWEGRVMGISALALSTVINTVYGVDESNSEIGAAFSYQVLQHAFGRQQSISDWAIGAIETLEWHLPRNGETGEREITPVELLCPDRRLSRETFTQLCEKSKRTLRLTGNPFLNPANR